MLFQNICSDASRVQDSWNLAKTRVRTKKKNPCISYFVLSCTLLIGGNKERLLLVVVVEFS